MCTPHTIGYNTSLKSDKLLTKQVIIDFGFWGVSPDKKQREPLTPQKGNQKKINEASTDSMT